MAVKFDAILNKLREDDIDLTALDAIYLKLDASNDPLTGTLTSSGAYLTSSYLRVGSTSAPTNTTAGDITGVRLKVGTDSAFGTSTFADFSGTLTDTANAARVGINNSITLDPAATSTTQFRAYAMSLTIDSANTQAFNNGTGIMALYSETRILGSGAITATVKAGLFQNFFGTNFASASNVQAISVQATNTTGTPTGTITNAVGLKVDNSTVGSGPLVITNLFGIDISAQTRGGTLNAGIRIAAPSGATANYALQLSDTGGTAAGGITFGTDVQLYRSAANVLTLDDQLTVTQANAANALNINMNANPGSTETTAGAVMITNTGSVHRGLNVYTNQGATQSTMLVEFFSDNTAFDQDVLYIRQDGTGASGAVNIDNNNTGVSLFVDHDDTGTNASAYIDRDGNNAAKIWGLKVDTDNAGAGGVGGIDMSSFSVDEALLKAPDDAITNPGTLTKQIAVDIGGTVYYLYAYTTGT